MPASGAPPKAGRSPRDRGDRAGTTPNASGAAYRAGCPENLLPCCPEEARRYSPGGMLVNGVNPNRDAPTSYSDAIKSHCPKAYAWSKQDTEPANRTMYQCASCTGFTITFHGGS